MPSKRSSLIFAAGLFTGLVCVVISAFYLHWLVVQRLPSNPPPRSPGLNAPKLISNQRAVFSFRLAGKDMVPFDFQKYRGRIIVLNLWATWCGPCMAELHSFGELAAHYATDKDIEVLCLSVEPPEVIFKNAEALRSGAPLYSINGTRLPAPYAFDEVIPVTFIIDPQGMIVARHVGAADWADPSVFKFIDALKRDPESDTGIAPASK